jgi:hypothetical protein
VTEPRVAIARPSAWPWLLLVALVSYLSALVLTLGGCQTVGSPKPQTTPAGIPQSRAEAECRDLYLQELHRPADPGGLASCAAALVAGRTGEQQRAILKASPEWVEAHRPPPPVEVVHSDGRIFRTASGQPWRWKGVTAFKLLQLYAAGQDVDQFLDAYKGFNTLRVWPYVVGTTWKGGDWPTPPSGAQAKAFLAYVAARGWHVEFTLLTNADPAKLAWANQFVTDLASGTRPTNLFLEAGNEPRTHTPIDTAALRSTLAASGFEHSSGDYEQSARFYGTYGTAHTDRSADWPRRAHDLLEYFQGKGPHTLTDPAHPVPWVADEPGKPADVGTNDADWSAYFGGAALMGAGATFHCESNKYGLLPDATERHLATVALDALNAFPADAPLGGYRRIVEAGQAKEARTYVIGSSMVRSQQKGPNAPEAGWTPLDALGVLWRR